VIVVLFRMLFNRHIIEERRWATVVIFTNFIEIIVKRLSVLLGVILKLYFSIDLMMLIV